MRRPPTAAGRLLSRVGRGTLAGTAIVISAFWVSICAAAPEFIWQGLHLAVGHLNRTELLGALLIGIVLAFFVEPVMEHIRVLLSRPRHQQRSDHQPSNALFAASLALAFALTSVCLHEAMTAFVSERGGAPAAPDAGLAAGIELTVAWAIVPFAVTIAWLTVRPRWLAVPTGGFAIAASYLTGWLFNWPLQSVITTTIPCLVILAMGYRHMLRTPSERALARCARSVACVAATWLIMAMVFDAGMPLVHLGRFELYDAAGFWMDVRFYIGWTFGLTLAPPPYREAGSTPDR
ncbi:MAG TPA: hypothetical protein VKI44_40740 [Acetobacteraceae bacterium]|nr:hypothetical protein [Acetobacteraceae bacterium]